MDDRDCFRFVHGLALFNTNRPATNTTYLLGARIIDFVNRYEEERIVDIHAWCLMSNHYHLLLSERVDGGMTRFLRKLNVGYANYFNQRYKRSGSLYQGRTKKKHIDSDPYFLHILNYIHFNPLDLAHGCNRWRQREITDGKAALDQLAKYRWSSYQDYCGRRNFPSVVTTDFFKSVFGTIEKSSLDHLASLEVNPDYVLE